MFRRNQNFLDILRLLCLGDKNSAFDISLRFTHLFWCGDLNYRLDLDVQVRSAVVISKLWLFIHEAQLKIMSVSLSVPHGLQDILKHVSKREFEELMCADQLTRERRKRKAFLNFSEFCFTADVFVYLIKELKRKRLQNCFIIDEASPLLSSLGILSLFFMVKRKRRFLFHPPTGMNAARGTATYGKSTRLQE